MERESFKPTTEGEPKEQLESAIHLRLEGKKTLEKERSPNEVMELKDRLRFVAKLMAKNFDLRVIPGDGWAAGLSQRFQEERRKHPDKSLEEFDPALLTPEVMMYPQKDLLERSEDYIWGVFRHELGHVKHSDYQSLLEAQDGAKKEGYSPMDLFMIYDAWEDGRSNNMEGQTSKAARHRLGSYLKEDIAEALLLDFEKKPLPIQYGALCWAKGAGSFIEGFNFEELKARIKDEKVLKAFEKTKEALDEYLGERKGRKAFTDVLWQKGWPVFKELIDKYIEDEAKKNHDQKQPSESKSWDELSPEEKEQYINEAREKLTEEEREFVKRLQPKSIQMKEREDGTIEITVQGVTPEDIKQAEQEEQKFEEQKKKIEQEAGKYKEAAVKEVKESLEKLKERETGLTEEEREKYNKYYAEIKRYQKLFVDELNDILPKIEEGWISGQRRGGRISRNELAREIAIKRGAFMKSKVEAFEPSPFMLSILIDMSTSMKKNDKIIETLKASILLSEVLSDPELKAKIPFEIHGFKDDPVELKNIDEEYAGKNKLKLLNLLHIGGSDYNVDSVCLDKVATEFEKTLQKLNAKGILIVESDGLPYKTNHSRDTTELPQVIAKHKGRIPIIGVGIGPGTEHVKDFYGENSVVETDVRKFIFSFLKAIKRQIEKLVSQT